MSTQIALEDAPAATEAKPSGTKPAASKQLGWSSVAYFPKEKARKSDGEVFTAHDFALRLSYRKDDKIAHVDMTIPRKEVLNMAECLRDVYSKSYDLRSSDELEE